jgi:hypothetical protein
MTIPTSTPAPAPAAIHSPVLDGRKLTLLRPNVRARRRSAAMAAGTGEFVITSVRCCGMTTGAEAAITAGPCAWRSCPTCAGMGAGASGAITPSTMTELEGSWCIRTVAGAGAWVPLSACTAPRTSADVPGVCSAIGSPPEPAPATMNGASSISQEGRNAAASRSACSIEMRAPAKPGGLAVGSVGSAGRATEKA